MSSLGADDVDDGRGLPSAESVGGSAATSTTAGAAATVTDGGKPAVSTDESDQKAIAELTGKAVEEEKKTSTTSEETSTTPEETSTVPESSTSTMPTDVERRSTTSRMDTAADVVVDRVIVDDSTSADSEREDKETKLIFGYDQQTLVVIAGAATLVLMVLYYTCRRTKHRYEPIPSEEV